MAIVQISKIQQRSGNIVDLPQLDEAEFGFASDAKRLFIGKVSPNENIEVLTSYSNIAFSQLEGSVGNLDISAISVDDGQVLAYDGTNWVNRGGDAGGLIDLGNVANVSISGGAIGYVLETDGLGNLAWTPKGTLYTPIIALSNATPIIMRVANTVPYTNGTAVTITGSNGANANTIVNGQTFYITLSVDYATSGNVRLYTDVSRTVAAVGTNLGASTPNVAIATSVISGAGGGTGVASGSANTIQFNNSGILDGDADFTWDYTNNILTVSGNANVGNLNATGSVVASTLTSNITTGTAPLTVTSTTRVANLNVARANVSDFTSIALQTTGTFYPTFVGGSASGNRAVGANANLSFNAATGNLSSTILNATGNISGANLDTAGNVTASRLISNVATGTAPLTVTSTTRVANLNVAYANVADFISVADVTTGTFYPVLANAASGNISEGSNANLTFNAATGALNSTLLGGTITTAAQPNITSVGNLTSLTVSGTLTANDIATFGTAGDTLNITGAGNVNVNGAGGIVNISAAQGNGTGQGGNLTLIGGAANSLGNAAGGIATLTAGAGYGQGQGGTVGIYSGASANTYGAKGGNVVITGGTYDGAGGDMTISGGEAAGLNHIGGDISIKAGASTGNATPGKIVIQTATAGSTGNTVQTLSNRVIIDDTQMNVTFNTASSSTTTGALEVAGGVGVGGNVYAAAFYGAATGLTSIPAGNILGTVANATHASTANTVVNAAQSNITSVGTLTGLTVASGAITATTPISVTQTWNNASVAFTGIRENITDTSSAAGSYLMDLQVDGTSRFVVTKTGNIAVGSSGAGNVTAGEFYGAATGLTSIPGGNVTGTVANATHSSTANTVVNAAQANITSVGTLTGLSVASGSITATTPISITQTWNNASVAFTGIRENITNTASAAGSLLLDLQVDSTSQFTVAANGSIVVGQSGNGSITANVLTTGANTTAGTVTGNWTLTAGSRLNATYADLAEYYEADQVYDPGTVLEFGGEKEVTLAQDGTTRVAGVVSTDPAYAMNTKCPGIAVAIALQGRVPTKVRGTVRKGDMMVSAGNGYARPWNNPQMGTVIGKALENFDGIEGVIEVAVGRL
jgi:hypothetical protein